MRQKIPGQQDRRGRARRACTSRFRGRRSIRRLLPFQLLRSSAGPDSAEPPDHGNALRPRRLDKTRGPARRRGLAQPRQHLPRRSLGGGHGAQRPRRKEARRRADGPSRYPRAQENDAERNCSIRSPNGRLRFRGSDVGRRNGSPNSSRSSRRSSSIGASTRRAPATSPSSRRARHGASPSRRQPSDRK